MLSHQPWKRTCMLVSSLAVTLLSITLAHAAPFQEGKFRNCTNENICRLNFDGPGPNRTLTIQHITCKVLTTQAAPAWVVQLFDGTNALYLKTEIQDNARRSFVAGGPVLFRTGGDNIHVEALLGAFMDSQIACTITGNAIRN
jgi:hypothetical protein